MLFAGHAASFGLSISSSLQPLKAPDLGHAKPYSTMKSEAESRQTHDPVCRFTRQHCGCSPASRDRKCQQWSEGPRPTQENAQGGELKAVLVGQVARALTIYGVDEVRCSN